MAASRKEWKQVGSFDQFGVAESLLAPGLGVLDKFRLKLHSSSDNWAILSEIFLKRWLNPDHPQLTLSLQGLLIPYSMAKSTQNFHPSLPSPLP